MVGDSRSWDCLPWKCHRRVSSGVMVLSTIKLIIARVTVFSKNKMDDYDWTASKFNGQLVYIMDYVMVCLYIYIYIC
jgi:hypothetical protein